MEERLLVDKAWFLAGTNDMLLLQIDGKYYKAINRVGGVDRNTLTEVEESRIKGSKQLELCNWQYLMAKLEPKSGYNLTLRRSITDAEFEALKKEYELTDDDISEPYTAKRGGIYGKKYEKTFKCVAIRVNPVLAIELEEKLLKKGIEAGNVNSGIVEIRIPEYTIKTLREHTGMKQSDFAAYFGLSVRSVQEWEQGNKKEPPYLVDLLERVWKAEKEN